MKVAAETPKGDNPKTNGVVKTPANDTLQHYVHFNKK
jgi:hypothetical protein